MNTTKKHLLIEFEPVDIERYGINKDSNFLYFFKNNYYSENIYIMGVSDLLAWYGKYHREVHCLVAYPFKSEREFVLELKSGPSVRVRIVRNNY